MEIKNSDHSLFTYIIMKDDSFPDPAKVSSMHMCFEQNILILKAPDPRTAYLWKLRRECRGLVFSYGVFSNMKWFS